jgi:hypothetical protein
MANSPQSDPGAYNHSSGCVHETFTNFLQLVPQARYFFCSTTILSGNTNMDYPPATTFPLTRDDVAAQQVEDGELVSETESSEGYQVLGPHTTAED